MGVRGMPSKATFLTNVTRVVNQEHDALLKSASGAGKLTCTFDRVLMKLEAKLVNLVGIEAELLKGIYLVRDLESPTHPQHNGVEGE